MEYSTENYVYFLGINGQSLRLASVTYNRNRVYHRLTPNITSIIIDVIVGTINILIRSSAVPSKTRIREIVSDSRVACLASLRWAVILINP